jgi:ATP-binding cassette subfamily A (ABC1) protein 5
MFRDIQRLYFMIILPLGFAAGGLYIHSIQSTDPKMKSLILNGGDKIHFIYSQNTII